MQEVATAAVMVDVPATAGDILAGLQEPALITVGRIVAAANRPARALLGEFIEGRDVRLAIRHPHALEQILSGTDSDVEVTGLGQVGQPWTLSVRRIGDGAVLVRLQDRAELVSAEKMRVDFVANASHELRTPLAAITGYAETLSDDEQELPPELRSQFARTMLEEARRMLQLIEDLMSLSRIQADRFAMPTESVSISPILESAVRDVRRLREAHGCEISLHLPPDLPTVRGDRAQLAQLFDNVLSNAVRYGGGTRGTPKVEVRAKAEQGWVQIVVRDHGAGIPREHLPRLTERFYRVDPARSRHSGGTGLGLAIVKHIVERHRGSLRINSEVGAGTTVTIRLPVGA